MVFLVSLIIMPKKLLIILVIAFKIDIEGSIRDIKYRGIVCRTDYMSVNFAPGERILPCQPCHFPYILSRTELYIDVVVHPVYKGHPKQ